MILVAGNPFYFQDALYLLSNRNKLTIIEFKDVFFDLACSITYQVYACYPDFDRNNFTHWGKKKYLIRLRQGYRAFQEIRGKFDFAF